MMAPSGHCSQTYHGVFVAMSCCMYFAPCSHHTQSYSKGWHIFRRASCGCSSVVPSCTPTFVLGQSWTVQVPQVTSVWLQANRPDSTCGFYILFPYPIRNPPNPTTLTILLRDHLHPMELPRLSNTLIRSRHTASFPDQRNLKTDARRTLRSTDFLALALRVPLPLS
jgi:hypothetical protein